MTKPPRWAIRLRRGHHDVRCCCVYCSVHHQVHLRNLLRLRGSLFVHSRCRWESFVDHEGAQTGGIGHQAEFLSTREALACRRRSGCRAPPPKGQREEVRCGLSSCSDYFCPCCSCRLGHCYGTRVTILLVRWGRQRHFV